MQRLAGIVLKCPFAEKGGGGVPYYSETGAQHSWPWREGALDELKGTPEYNLLDELRFPGPWHLPGREGDEITFDELKFDADTERGLFKIAALYVVDKFNKREPKTLREYLDAKESYRFEAGLDLAQLLFEEAVTVPIASIVGVPTLGVGIALIGIHFGYRWLTDPNPNERHPDGSS
ncbi:hypothetical protein WI29_08370 [Burkholderia ubonensis]|nr:hypothetical protein WI31_11245 [Burkholderia ubonensis]KUZ25674.1 hypothetical protein WI29_08370 [Burkholderia ubonensis]KUZ26043.1 hypothetical protein WI30_25970 [Burkholderia ubonensis]KUZ27830.1 hypothetical protein WI32_27910 [Burkholderia ubonensis]KUZ57762.1 hypothetical protein WI33_03240 [Burkholderia ubonensis]